MNHPGDQEVERAREWPDADAWLKSQNIAIGTIVYRNETENSAGYRYLSELLAAYALYRDAGSDRFGDSEPARHMAGIKGACARAARFAKDAAHGYAGRNREAWLRGWEYANDCLRDPNYKPVGDAEQKSLLLEYEYPPEIKSICDRCEANVTNFSNDDVSKLLVEIDRISKMLDERDAEQKLLVAELVETVRRFSAHSASCVVTQEKFAGKKCDHVFWRDCDYGECDCKLGDVLARAKETM